MIDDSNVTNGFTLNGGMFNLLTAGTGTAYSDVGTYNLVKYQGTIQGTALDSGWTTPSTTNLHIANPQVFKSYAFGTASFAGANALTLTIVSTTTAATWGGATSNWAPNTNWTNGTAPRIRVISVFSARREPYGHPRQQ